MIIQSPSELNSRSLRMPAGRIANKFEFECFAVAIDVLDARTYLNTTIVVNQAPSLDLTTVTAGLSDSIDSGFLTGDLDAVKSSVSSGATVLNTVDCSLAPDCNVLDREECDSIVNTCGICQDGYVGQTGAANSQCYSKTTTRRRRLSVSDSSTSCSSDSDCTSIFELSLIHI